MATKLTPEELLLDRIKTNAYKYRMMRQGRGKTHEKAYITGAMDMLNIIKCRSVCR